MTKEPFAHRADGIPSTQAIEILLPMRSVVGGDDYKEMISILAEKHRDDLLYLVTLQVPQEKQPVVLMKR